MRHYLRRIALPALALVLLGQAAVPLVVTSLSQDSSNDLNRAYLQVDLAERAQSAILQETALQRRYWLRRQAGPLADFHAQTRVASAALAELARVEGGDEPADTAALLRLHHGYLVTAQQLVATLNRRPAVPGDEVQETLLEKRLGALSGQLEKLAREERADAATQLAQIRGNQNRLRLFAVDAGVVRLLLLGALIWALYLFRSRKQVEEASLHRLAYGSPLPTVVLDLDHTVRLWNAAAEETFGWNAAEVLGRPLPVVPAARQEESEQLLAAARRGQKLSNVVLERQRKDGTPIVVSLTAGPLYNEKGQVSAVMYVYVDVTERERLERERANSLARETVARRKAEEAADRIARLQQVTARLSRALTPAEIAEIIVSHGVEALGASAGQVGLLTGTGDEVELVASVGYDPDLVERFRLFPVSASIPIADAIRLERPIWMGTAETWQELYPDGANLHEATGNEAAAAIPLLTGGRVLGGLGLSFREAQEFDATDREFVVALANQCTQALERAQLYEAQRQARLAAETAESALRDSETRFRAIFEQAAVGVALVGPDGRYQLVNQRVCEMLGYSAHELQQKTYVDITHPDDRENDRAYDRRLRAGEIPSSRREKRYIRKDGSILWIDLTVSLVRRPDGEPNYFIAVMEDITARKQAEEALRRSEKELRRVVDGMQVGVAVIGKDGEIRLANRTSREMLGVPGEGKRGGTVQQRSWPCLAEDGAELPLAERPIARAIASGRPVLNTVMGVRREGSGDYLWVLEDAVPELGPDGEVEQVIVTMTDISARRAAEEALRESEERFRALFEHSPDGIMLLDPHHPTIHSPIVACNECAARMNGYSRQELIGQPITLLTRDEPIREELDEYVELLRREGTVTAEDIHFRKDGSSFPVEYATSLIRLGGRELVLGIDRDVSERKRMEAAIAASEEKYRLTFDLAPVGVAHVSPEGTFLSINRRLEEMLGYSWDELAGTPFTAITHPDDLDRNLDLFDRLMAGEIDSYAVEKRYVRKDGSVVWANVHTALVRDSEGRPAHTISVIEDTTERKNMELALQESEERFRTIFQQAGIGINFSDQGGYYLETNPAFDRMLGYQPGELRGAHFTQITHPGDADTDAQLFAELAAGTHTSYTMEKRYLSKDGEAIPVRLTVTVVPGPDGSILHTVGMAEDIRGQKLAEAKDAQLAAIVQGVPVALIHNDLDGIIQSWNPGAEKLYGYRADEVIGKPVGILVPPDLGDENADLLCRIRRGEGVEQYETVNVTKDGSRLDVMLTLAPLCDASGEVTAAAAIAYDVSEQKRAREALKQMNLELEQRVTERTAELVAANRELETFAYSVSHDLRAPLRSISGFSQALLEDYADKLDEEGKEYLDIVVDSCRQMGSLIDDLLRLSRVTRAEMRSEQVDLTDMAEAIVDQLRAAEPRRDVSVRIEPGLAAWGDAGLLRVGLENLLNNAWKFTRHTPGASIELGRAQSNGYATFYVRDTGVGFNMDYADKLFGAFQRVHDASQYEGTGIGLATVQRVVRRHGGEIWAEGKEGEGATFYFTLNGHHGSN